MSAIEIKNKYKYRIVVIGGSAGSFPLVNTILESLPIDYKLPVVMCLHRLKDKRGGFKEALEIKSKLPIGEPNDKDTIDPGHVYLAPANYHLLIETKRSFALSTTDLVQYSRPSIDVLMESCADVFKTAVVAIILSGANKDGAQGVRRIKEKGGLVIVQNPEECSISTMPQAAIKATEIDHILNLKGIIDFLKQLN